MPRNKTLKSHQYGGFVLGFEPARTETIAEHLLNNWRASESFSSQDWNLQPREMVYLARRGPRADIFGAALLQRRGRGGGTKRVRMLFAEAVIFNKPVLPTEANGGEKFDEMISTAENVKRYRPALWDELNKLIADLRPEHREQLERLASLRVAPTSVSCSDNRSLRLAEERDAVGLAIDIAGLSRAKIFRGANGQRFEGAQSILDILDAQPIAERSLIERDSIALKLALETAVQHARFKDDRGREVRTYVLDSTPLETATGVDLLLYQSTFNSFLLLQYKAMEKDDVVTGWSYRADGTNLISQLDTMTRVRSAIPSEPPKTIKDQRLSEEPFYFKFCERRLPTASEDSLVPGITMGASHLVHFLSLPQAIQEGRGRRIGYENCARYFSNSDFVTLARGGWIGCQGYTSEAIAQIVAGREKGRVGIVGVIQGLELRSQNRARQP